MITEKIMIEESVKGDQTVFETSIHQYYPAILGYLERLLKDRQKAEDLVQETFVKLLRQLRDRSTPDHVSAWLYRVAANLCRDYWKSAGYQKEQQVLDQLKDQKDEQMQVVELCERRETREEMLSLLNELPEMQREIVILRYYNELKLYEVAEVIGCPIGTVKSRLFYALRLLKSRMEENGRVDHG
ncbi:MAG TPA: RNA polymerase sigma factor [Bacillales bacterium]|nr:RNA polymerase sigma factor [Bacillales bacterium]